MHFSNSQSQPLPELFMIFVSDSMSESSPEDVGQSDEELEEEDELDEA